MDKILDRLMPMVAEDDDGSDYAEVMRYGLELLLMKIFFTAVVIIIGAVTGCFFETLVFMFLFLPLRENAGGFHASSRTLCLIESVCLVGIVISFIKFDIFDGTVSLIITASAALLSTVIIFITAPVDCSSRRLDEDEKTVIGRKTRLILSGEILLAVIGFILYRVGFSFPLLKISMLSIIAAAVLLIMGKIKNSRDKEYNVPLSE
ncbi:MAG: accessory gene regulator B family protein [Ruminococcus sp.]|jgi:accessory gene regulator B|nr:accessory gene regulator B family protein [Ruminococcus sp.]